MALCSVCTVISFADLPPFPEEQHGRILTGLQYVHPLRREREFPRDPTGSSVRHHKSLEHLQEAAAAGCVLCALIQDQLDLLLSEIEGLDIRTKTQYYPTVDLWLAKRPRGGQGFWVLSESIRSMDEREIIPIAAFNFAVANNDPLADLIHARPVQQSPETHALQQLLEWETKCKQYHECCRPSTEVPRYLIDVSRSEFDDDVKLVQLGTTNPIQYIALSYTSDRRSEVQPQSHNPNATNNNLSIATLPKMFRDAIQVTRALGVRYIWIDSLCIPGNPPEWEGDSEEIGSVYENAYLTLSATGAENVADGLLFPRPSRHSVHILYGRGDGSVNGTVSISALPLGKEVLHSYVEMEMEPISQDIWSFQERVLSRRIAHFASDQLYFECLRHLRSEDGLLQNSRFHSTAERLDTGPDYYREQTVLDRWHSILRAYGQREPPRPSDKLAALSNIARAFQRLLGDDYVAGLWRKSLIESLCWRSMNHTPQCDSTAPSWSWARVNSATIAGFGSKSGHPEATISNVQVMLEKESKPFGNVTSALIVIQAPIVPLKLVEQSGGEGRAVFLRTENGHEGGFYAGFDVIERQYEVSAESIRKSELFALVLAKTHRHECLAGTCHAATSICAIIVSPVDGSVDRLERIGFITAPVDRFWYGSLSASRRTVTLV